MKIAPAGIPLLAFAAWGIVGCTSDDAAATDAPEIKYHTSWTAAKEESSSTGKPIFLSFGGPW